MSRRARRCRRPPRRGRPPAATEPWQEIDFRTPRPESGPRESRSNARVAMGRAGTRRAPVKTSGLAATPPPEPTRAATDSTVAGTHHWASRERDNRPARDRSRRRGARAGRPAGRVAEQLTVGRLWRPDDAGEGEMGVEAVFARHAGLSQGIAQVRLQGDQAREIDIRDARPQDARARDTRKRADALRGELKAWISPNDGGERVR